MFFLPLLRTASTLLGQKETKNPLKNLLAKNATTSPSFPEIQKKLFDNKK
ncbi:MAG: hypothetical protein FWC82_02770 [Firmicutes bacterium]|nr:hypothetical protein [Bacillota bacterium]